MTTNFEKIKTMSIEELAEFFAELSDDCCAVCGGNWTKGCYLECDKHIKQWLESESEEQ